MILTKKEYCKTELAKHFDTSDYSEKLTPNIIRKTVVESTIAGICLEELGYINEVEYPDLVEYLSHRGGCFATYVDKTINPITDGPTIKIMSFREFLSLLPDV